MRSMLPQNLPAEAMERTDDQPNRPSWTPCRG
jgi:hypothetical protein